MATFKYPYAIKVNGMVIPPNTPVELKEEATADTVADVEKTAEKRAAKKKE